MKEKEMAAILGPKAKEEEVAVASEPTTSTVPTTASSSTVAAPMVVPSAAVAAIAAEKARAAEATASERAAKWAPAPTVRPAAVGASAAPTAVSRTDAALAAVQRATSYVSVVADQVAAHKRAADAGAAPVTVRKRRRKERLL